MNADWKQIISAYVDGALSAEETKTAEKLIAERPECRAYLNELRAISKALQTVKDEPLSPDASHQILKNAQKERTMKSSQLKTPALVLASLVVCVLVFHNYTQRGVQGKLKSSIDNLGDQFSPNNASTLVRPQRIDTLADGRLQDASTYPAQGASVEYEPHYQTSTYIVPAATPVRMEALQKRKAETMYLAMEKTANGYDKDAEYRRLARGTVAAKENFASLQVGEGDLQLASVRDRNEYWGREQLKSRAGEQTTSYKEAMPMVAGNDSALADYASNRAYYQYPQYPAANTEEYSKSEENRFLTAQDNPLSTFSIDVDTASYSNIRRYLSQNQMPPPDAVRIEEMINYFDYNYPEPSWGQPFSVTLEQGACPWNPSHQLVLVGLQGRKIAEGKTPESNLVFLIDVSGSMSSADKLPLLKDSLRMMVGQLRPQERVSMVVYAGNAGLVLDSTPGYDKQTILSAIDNLSAGGSTAGGQGIQLAYDIARKNFIPNGNNRVILATDGDFNVGVTSDSALVRMIEAERKGGIFLTVLGLGTGNLKDSKMEQLADKGNGNYFYIDNLNEGKKVLVDELGSTIFTIAKDVKIQVEFNPAHVKEYRLVGYENRKLAKEDFKDDTKDAGELGAGHTVTALYEIVPAGAWESHNNVDPLKYQQQAPKKSWFFGSNEIMTVKLRYKEPNSDTSKLITKALNKPNFSIRSNWYGASDNLNFASAVAEFGMILRGSEFRGNATYQDVISRAQASSYNDQWGYRGEFLGLVQRAMAIDQRQYQPQPVPVYQPYYNPGEQDRGYGQKN